MRVGIIGTGLMGSSLARCLTRKGVSVGLYNRTRGKALEVARETGATVYDSPGDLLRGYDAVVALVSDDYALKSVAEDIAEKAPYSGLKLFVNASTVTPMASIEVYGLLEGRGAYYVEAPVYGSIDEARECRLLTVLACNESVKEAAINVAGLYSTDVVYVGRPPRAIAIKLALNNIGLALPALLAESLMLIKAWGADVNSFINLARRLWFGSVIDRYWSRVVEDRPPRFKLKMAGKDYWYIASALQARGLPANVSSAISSLYAVASLSGLGDRDYPQVARYYLELARNTQSSEQATS